MERLSIRLTVCLTAALVCLGCRTDAMVDVTNNGSADAGVDGSANGGDGSMANNVGNNVTTPTTPSKPLPTTFSLTNGGGTATSQDHRLQLTIGSPQPHGQASDAETRLLIGPIVPVAGE